MPAPSLDRLLAPYPQPSHRLDPTDPSRTMAEACAALAAEDRTRAAILRRAKLDDRKLEALAHELVARIDPETRDPDDPPVPTLAAATDMWRFRAGLVGAGTPLVRSDHNARFVTANPRAYTLSPGQLLRLRPKSFLSAVRADLDRLSGDQGLQRAGWLIAGLHGEWRPDINSGLVHWHGIASSDMLSTIQGLRGLGKYEPNARTRACPDGMKRRVFIKPEPINLPSALTYCAQQFWPSRWVGEVELGRDVRALSSQRMPVNALVHWLLWMDRQRFSDLVLLYRCRVKGGIIQVS